MESSPPQKHGGQLHWALGDHKFSRTSGWMGGLIKMMGVKFSALLFLGGMGGTKNKFVRV